MASQPLETGVLLILFAVASGILPAVFWLWFWLKEDKKRPEPLWMLSIVFLSGSLAVIPAFFLEKKVADADSPAIFAWSAIEEMLKYLAVYLIALKSRYFDEPVDAMIYMITGALGFAAVENTLFMINTIGDSGTGFSFLLTGNFRFIGATIVHIVASAIVGCFVGLAFYSRRIKRVFAAAAGLALAIALHALFNYSIISQGEKEIMTTFVILWLLAILVIFLFERVKKTIIQIKVRKFN